MSDKKEIPKEVIIFWVIEEMTYKFKDVKRRISEAKYGPFADRKKAEEGIQNLRVIEKELETRLKKGRFGQLFLWRYTNVGFEIAEEIVASGCLVVQFPDEEQSVENRMVFHAVYGEKKDREEIHLMNPGYVDLVWIRLSSMGFWLHGMV
ncbi:MAG: hypothetical protein A3A04_00480 [Candidatus Harrisonbacteria bacterium RIFCSPLOWO2_01_FULL_40_28]|uniref:Uncharacterized protein n=1 Tax=Candidatus Harrisonbacteria bacterium RIFCSPLOWO2_01_FULL_40_28 TaxID=1798406 RepID=A0A1G1ZP42_9BACT|nr:MAG: hypothetical protein A3A04_00480 [Candidatus Harrisonbacteria bacterium RIFCSPLOWO2_01_FULL_40_28]